MQKAKSRQSFKRVLSLVLTGD